MRLIDADALFDAAFEVWGTEADAGETNQFMEMINNAPTVPPPPNDPLTLEQLREMGGERVWNDTVKRYAIVDARWMGCIGRTISTGGICRSLDDCYYRRKPEEKEP